MIAGKTNEQRQRFFVGVFTTFINANIFHQITTSSLFIRKISNKRSLLAHCLLFLSLFKSNTMEHLQRDWYVVYSNPHKEEQARFHLGLKGVETFFPRLSLPAGNEKKKRIIPLFPNYIFVRVHMPSESHLIIWTLGVKKIISFGDEPIPLDESVVGFLQQQADTNGVIEARSKLRRGQEVEISGGPFDGLMGIIQSPPDGQGRVKVLLKLLSRQVSVNFGVEFIKGGQTAWAPPVVGDIGTGLNSAIG